MSRNHPKAECRVAVDTKNHPEGQQPPFREISHPNLHADTDRHMGPGRTTLFFILFLSPIQGAAAASNASTALARENSQHNDHCKHENQNSCQRVQQSTFHNSSLYVRILTRYRKLLKVIFPCTNVVWATGMFST
jgi:hypothetical protein